MDTGFWVCSKQPLHARMKGNFLYRIKTILRSRVTLWTDQRVHEETQAGFRITKLVRIKNVTPSGHCDPVLRSNFQLRFCPSFTNLRQGKYQPEVPHLPCEAWIQTPASPRTQGLKDITHHGSWSRLEDRDIIKKGIPRFKTNCYATHFLAW